MTILGIGVDVVDLARFADTLERTPTMRSRLFTEAEARSAGRVACRAVRRQGGVGQGAAGAAGHVMAGHRGHQRAAGAPEFQLYGAALDRAKELGIATAHLSISHDTSVATAFVVAEC